MSEIKMIKIGGVKSRGSLDDILNSSSKIRDLIKKKKTMKNMAYLDKLDFQKPVDNLNIVKPVEPKVIEPTPTKPMIIEKPKINIENTVEPKKKTPVFKKQTLENYGNNLEQTTLSKRKKKHAKKAANPITSYFNTDLVNKKKSKKYNRNEIKYIISSFKKLYEERNYKKLNIFISKLTRDQTIQILYACNVVEYKTDAPLPLLKNIVFNIVLGNIRIMR